VRLWRLSGARHAGVFDGGYGLLYKGRWNTKGRPVTYCSTVPSLCALEKRVHVADPALLPDQIMVEYEAPDDLTKREIILDDLPFDWSRRETRTQQIGDAWLDGGEDALLVVPSVIMPIGAAPDRNILINHRRADAARIRIVGTMPFTLDPRLFAR
jgi:RES domain-containing protein